MPAAAARWIVPAAVTALVVGGGVAASASSDAVPDLPERSAADLLVSIGEAEPVPFSGTVRTVAELGLPDLSALTGANGGAESATDPASALMRLATGENSLRVWVGGPDQQRVSLLDDFSELDVVRDGDVAWTYSSSEDTATRYDLAAIASRAQAEHDAAHGGAADGAVLDPAPEPTLPDDVAPFADMTPDELARTLLAEADGTTEVSVGEAQVVAGRDAYTLVATPRDDATLVAGIEVAVDAETGLVLQVQVDARGQADPAFVTGFTDLDLTAPDAEVFDFTPPAGTTVVEALDEIDAKVAEKAAERSADEPSAAPFDEGALEEMFADAPEPVVHGEGWSTVVELGLPETPAGARTDEQTDEPSADVSGEDASPFGGRDAADEQGQDVDPAEVLGQLTTEVDGGRVLTSALLSVLLTDDGRVLVGSVDAATLQGYAG